MNRRDFLLLATAAPFAFRAEVALAARPPLALVTCDTEGRIAVVDVVRGRIVTSIEVPAAPHSIERVGAAAVVCHTNTGVLTILDGERLEVRHVLDGFDEPRYTAAHPDGRYAFVTDSGSREVVSLDLVRGRVTGRVRLGEWPRHITIDSAGQTLWVGLGNESERLAIVDVSDPSRSRLRRRLRTPFLAHDVGFLPDGRHVWVTSGSTGAMAVCDRDGEVAFRLPADGAPQHVRFGRGVAYVTSGAAGTFRVHSLRDGHALRTTRVPIGSYNVETGFGRVLTPSLGGGTLTILDRRGVLLHEVTVAASCHDACFV